MQYRNNKTGQPISILGYGCMRFSHTGRNIDIDKAEKEILKAIEMGVNYFDTAYIYQGSEAALGEILSRNKIRDKVNIATKLPQYMMKNMESVERTFNEELTRLKTDYVDYYLMHLVTDIHQWKRLESMGIKKWIEEKKSNGQIRNIGFSYHGNTEGFLQVLDAYDWDFCQIQYNYIDEHSQAGRAGLEAAGKKGIPVVIMEPLRGGKLVDLLPEKAKKLIAESPSGYSPAEYAFRWLWDQEYVTCVLSGMNSLEMVEENCRAADTAYAGSFTQTDRDIIEKVKVLISESEKVGCTGCRYCMPCPKGVDIPLTFLAYNRTVYEKKNQVRIEYLQNTGLKKKPSYASMCIECGKWEKHCPQSLPIRQKLKEADKVLMPFPFKIGINIVRKFFLK